MTTELGSETVRDADTESERDVIEVTAEEVAEVAEPEIDSSDVETELLPDEPLETEPPLTEPLLTEQQETGSDAAEPAGAAAAGTVYCVRCGADMRMDDGFCRNCGWDSTYVQGVPQPAPTPRPRAPLPTNTSSRNRLTTLLLCGLLGPFGAHRFYLGKIGTGVLWLFTLGFLGLGVVFDLVMIATGECRDIDGKPVLRWE